MPSESEPVAPTHSRPPAHQRGADGDDLVRAALDFLGGVPSSGSESFGPPTRARQEEIPRQWADGLGLLLSFKSPGFSSLKSFAPVGPLVMTVTASLSPAELRPLLQNKIGHMSDDQVDQLHRVMQKLEAQQLWDEIKADGARDRAEGKFDRINEVIAEVRAEMAQA